MIKQLYNKYFQKSKIFLYPLLELPKVDKDEFFVETFLKYENVKLEDCKIICQFNVKNLNFFLNYRKEKILKSPYFIFEKQLNDNTYIFVFDLSAFKTSTFFLYALNNFDTFFNSVSIYFMT